MVLLGECLTKERKGRLLMKNVVWKDKSEEKFAEARNIIWKVMQENEELGKSLELSFHRSFETLNCMLTNFTLPKDKYGYVKDGYEYTLELYPDFVKGSFSFCFMYKEPEWEKPRLDFNGGMILHGFEETFSIELSNNNKPHWSIHT